MDKKQQNNNGYIGFEYREIQTPQQYSSLYYDSYPCFGWEPAPQQPEPVHQRRSSKDCTIRFRRDRKLCNRVELTRLQRNFDACVAEISALERSKRFWPMVWAVIIGVVGTSFITLSAFSATQEVPNVMLTILWAIPGFAGWIAPHFVFKFLVKKRTEKLDPLIDSKYEEIYEICDKGDKLLF